MSQPEHSALIASAAKDALTPLGFRRKGRSRVWLADRGYWLCVVEFQPSGFSRGSYLNTSAHWFWAPKDVLSFDYQLPDMKRPFISFENREQFQPLARELAELAASEAKRLDEQLSSFAEVARILFERNQGISEMFHRPAAEWSALHAAVAVGVLGRSALANALLEDFLNGPCAQFVGDWGRLAREALGSGAFLHFIRHTIDDARAGYGLPTWTGAFD